MLILVGLFFVVKNKFPFLITNFVPVSKEVKRHLPASSQTLSPFKVPNGKKLDIFADLKNELPRVMIFDDSNNMIVSLTSKGKVVVLKDSNNDLKSDSETLLLAGLNKPHGLSFNNGYLYVAQSNKVSRYTYNSDNLQIGVEEILFNLPDGGRHFTRTIKIYDGKLYTSVGSSCDVCVESNPFRATILVSNLDGSDLKVFAKGLRNTVFFDFDNSGKMWGADMGRDNLGDNLPPEEINIIEEGKDYGWPYCYSSNVKDTKFNTDTSISCDETSAPVYEIDAHSAPLGFVFDSSGNAYVALHGSWNSTIPVGYKVVKLNTFAGGVSGMEDYITGFISESGTVLGRPSGLVFDKNENLYIADDKSGFIYVLSD